MRGDLATVRNGRRESAGGRVRFSEAAKRAAVEHALRRERGGGSVGAAARETGVGYETLRRWLRERPAVQPVRVIEERQGGAVVLVLPGGSRVEGLTVGDVAELVRRLS